MPYSLAARSSTRDDWSRDPFFRNELGLAAEHMNHHIPISLHNTASKPGCWRKDMSTCTKKLCQKAHHITPHHYSNANRSHFTQKYVLSPHPTTPPPVHTCAPGTGSGGRSLSAACAARAAMAPPKLWPQRMRPSPSTRSSGAKLEEVRSSSGSGARVFWTWSGDQGMSNCGVSAFLVFGSVYRRSSPTQVIGKRLCSTLWMCCSGFPSDVECFSQFVSSIPVTYQQHQASNQTSQHRHEVGMTYTAAFKKRCSPLINCLELGPLDIDSICRHAALMRFTSSSTSGSSRSTPLAKAENPFRLQVA